jgi:hypothetical protein
VVAVAPSGKLLDSRSDLSWGTVAALRVGASLIQVPPVKSVILVVGVCARTVGDRGLNRIQDSHTIYTILCSFLLDPCLL